MNARDVLDALRANYPAAEWVFMEQVRASTGWGRAQYDAARGGYRMGRGEDAVEQILDAYAIQQWSPGRTLAFEVKVSRGDYLRELADPDKRAFALTVASEFYFVTPVGMIREGFDLPDGCGLIEVYDDGRVRTRHKAPTRVILRPDWGFVRSLTRRLRREMYEAAAGHHGQCRGIGWRTVKVEWGEQSERVDLRESGQWCAKEAGHPGVCAPRGPKPLDTPVAER